jgi:hypothetical protein
MREPLPVSELETASIELDPYVEAVRRVDLAALWSAIEELPRPQRDALLLREFGGLSYDELAEALAVSDSAVESLLFRARQRLRVRLRTAYASFGGASWLEGLARLFGGAPVAAKVAAISVGAATVTGSAVVVPQVLEQARSPVPRAHVHATVPRATKVRAAPMTAPAVVLAAQPRHVPKRTIARASSDEQQHDGGEAARQTTQARTDGSDGEAIGATLKEPVQQDTSDGRKEAGVSVQAPLETSTTTTDSHDGGDGIDVSGGVDGSSGGGD